MIVLNWVSDHYSDFEDNDEFLDWFEEMLIEDVSFSFLVSFTLSLTSYSLLIPLQGKIGEKRVLDEARLSNAKNRNIQIVSVSDITNVHFLCVHVHVHVCAYFDF